MANTIKFVQLSQAKYAALSTRDNYTIYFTTDTKRIYKGDSFFSNEIVTTTNSKANLQGDGSVVLNRLYVNTSTGAMYIATALKTDATDSKNTIVQIGADDSTLTDVANAKTTIGTTVANKIVTTGSDGNFQYVDAKASSIRATGSATLDMFATEKAVRDAIDDLDVSQIGGTGKIVTTISQADGKISATAIDLVASGVARSSSAGVAATTVQGAIAELQANIDASNAAQKSYKVVALTTDEITALSDANVKQAYKIQVSNNGGAYGDVTDSAPIKIYKDSSIAQIYLGWEGDSVDATSGVVTTADTSLQIETNRRLCYVYHTATGSYAMTRINVANFLTQSQFKNGLSVSDNGQVSVKIDTTNDQGYLSVTSDGLKVTGIKAAIAAESSRAAEAQSTLTNALNAESSRATQAQTTLTNALNAESSRATEAQTTLTNALNAASSSLDSSISTLDTKVDGLTIKASNKSEVAWYNSSDGTLSASSMKFGASSFAATPTETTLATELGVKNYLQSMLSWTVIQG